MLQRIMLDAWPARVVETSAADFTNSHTDHFFLPSAPAIILPLSATFRLGSRSQVAVGQQRARS